VEQKVQFAHRIRLMRRRGGGLMAEQAKERHTSCWALFKASQYREPAVQQQLHFAMAA